MGEREGEVWGRGKVRCGKRKSEGLCGKEIWIGKTWVGKV